MKLLYIKYSSWGIVSPGLYLNISNGRLTVWLASIFWCQNFQNHNQLFVLISICLQLYSNIALDHFIKFQVPNTIFNNILDFKGSIWQSSMNHKIRNPPSKIWQWSVVSSRNMSLMFKSFDDKALTFETECIMSMTVKVG